MVYELQLIEPCWSFGIDGLNVSEKVVGAHQAVQV